MERAITPPPLKRRRVEAAPERDKPQSHSAGPGQHAQSQKREGTHFVPSPFHLTQVYELPESDNVDTVSLSSIFSDGPFTSVWHFNFLFDLDFVMAALDPADRGSAAVHIVHGSWRAEDSNRRRINEAVKRYPNVRVVNAYMPEAFGTHHSKMMVLFRQDQTAQVVSKVLCTIDSLDATAIIHTANMIPFDWLNMTQGVWISPRLPALPADAEQLQGSFPLGSGRRFKTDLLRYLRAYESKRTGDLVTQLMRHDFDEVRGALIASVPSRDALSDIARPFQTSWGQKGLKEVVRSLPYSPQSSSESFIVAQVSSIASLGRPSSWLPEFMAVLHGRTALNLRQTTSIIFPDAEEVRGSLNGYASGSSIHMRTQSKEQQDQVQSLRPMLCHWTNDDCKQDACRGSAAPHIKTYIRFRSPSMDVVDYALLTSANLSQQAWGVPMASGHLRISSYEIGVMVWPQLYEDDDSPPEQDSSAMMVPVFCRNTPQVESLSPDRNSRTVIGLRMPYGLPLRKYTKSEMPWSPHEPQSEPDIHGQVGIKGNATPLSELRGMIGANGMPRPPYVLMTEGGPAVRDVPLEI